MIERKSNRPVLIDLIGAMPYTEELALLDKRVFLMHVVIDSCKRKGIMLNKDIMDLVSLNGGYEFKELYNAVNKLVFKDEI